MVAEVARATSRGIRNKNPGNIDRIAGVVEWARLPPDTQAAIGAAAIELVAAWVGLDSCNRLSDWPTTTDIKRARVLLEPGKAAEMPCASLSLGRIFNGPIMTINLVNDSDRPIEVSVPDIYHEIGSTLRIGLDIKDRPSARPGLLAKIRERLRALNDWLSPRGGSAS